MLAGLLAVSCAPLEVPVQATVQRCPKACAASCPDACLPSGYCSEVKLTASDFALQPIAAGAAWQLAFPGFPPGEQISLAMHAGFDIGDRAGRSPWIADITVSAAHDGLAFFFAGTFDSFPVWTDYATLLPTDRDGVLRVPLQMLFCKGEAPASCSIDPSSTFDARLVSSSAWLEAPPCAP